MEKKELIEWAIKGLENEIVILDSQIYNGRQDIRRIENGEYSRANAFKIRERVMRDVELKEQLVRKLFNLRWERALND